MLPMDDNLRVDEDQVCGIWSSLVLQPQCHALFCRLAGGI